MKDPPQNGHKSVPNRAISLQFLHTVFYSCLSMNTDGIQNTYENYRWPDRFNILIIFMKYFKHCVYTGLNITVSDSQRREREKEREKDRLCVNFDT